MCSLNDDIVLNDSANTKKYIDFKSLKAIN